MRQSVTKTLVFLIYNASSNLSYFLNETTPSLKQISLYHYCILQSLYPEIANISGIDSWVQG